MKQLSVISLLLLILSACASNDSDPLSGAWLIVLSVMSVFIIFVIIFRSEDEHPEIEKFDAWPYPEKLATENWIDNYFKGDCESHQDQNLLIDCKIKQLTDLVYTQGLIKSEEELSELGKLFKDRILNFQLDGKSVVIDEIRSAIERELSYVIYNSTRCATNEMSDALALATGIVVWFNNIKIDKMQDRIKMIALGQRTKVNESIPKSNAERAHELGDFVTEAEIYQSEAEQYDIFGDSKKRVYAQIMIARCYELGQGVDKDYVKAHMWAYIALNTSIYFKNILPRYISDLEKKMVASQIDEAKELAKMHIMKKYEERGE